MNDPFNKRPQPLATAALNTLEHLPISELGLSALADQLNLGLTRVLTRYRSQGGLLEAMAQTMAQQLIHVLDHLPALEAGLGGSRPDVALAVAVFAAQHRGMGQLNAHAQTVSPTDPLARTMMQLEAQICEAIDRPLREMTSAFGARNLPSEEAAALLLTMLQGLHTAKPSPGFQEPRAHALVNRWRRFIGLTASENMPTAGTQASLLLLTGAGSLEMPDCAQQAEPPRWQGDKLRTLKLGVASPQVPEGMEQIKQLLEALPPDGLAVITLSAPPTLLMALLGLGGWRQRLHCPTLKVWELEVLGAGASPPLDLRQEPTPVPMERILAQVRRLEPTSSFLAKTYHAPLPLYPQLEAQGVVWEVCLMMDGSAILHIGRP